MLGVLRTWNTFSPDGTHARTAITPEPARAPELGELMSTRTGLHARVERRVTERVAHGRAYRGDCRAGSTMSPYTVSDGVSTAMLVEKHRHGAV